MRGASNLLACLLLATAPACIPDRVEISSTANPRRLGTIEPVMFVIYPLSFTGPTMREQPWTVALQKDLLKETQRRGISAQVVLAEKTTDDEALKHMSRGMRGLVVINAVAETRKLLSRVPFHLLYDVRAYMLADDLDSDVVKAWRGRVDTNTGAWANQLIERMVQDGILHGSSKPPTPP